MIEFESFYDDFIRHLETIGYKSKMEDVEFNFPNYHNSTKTEFIPVRVIICPFTGRKILAKKVFDAYIKKIMLQLFFSPDIKTINSIFNEIQK